jgi:4-hydroxybenzoate polyprenyltransferase
VAELTQRKESWIKQVWHFLLHLRIHYQLFILSGAFLMGVLLSDSFNTNWFIVQFLNIHLLLFGGATAYNSFWDRDEGPIGGLHNPPKMRPWMWLGSLFLQMIGLLIALPMGTFFVALYALSMLFFWLYSSPWTRWKGRPFKSLVAIGCSTGFNTVLMGYIAAGHENLHPFIWIAAAGVTLILLSLYPVSQLYQQEEDRQRGDRTFAIAFGETVVLYFFEAAFLAGVVLTSLAIGLQHMILGLLFGFAGLLIGLAVDSKLKTMFKAKQSDYKSVMYIKYCTSLAFVFFLILSLILKHSSLPLFATINEWLFS